MKRFIKMGILGVVISLVLSTQSFAAIQTLWRATSTTYVTTEHGDGYFADKYYGTASVRGADRVIIQGRNRYFIWTRITYDVQGDIYSVTAYSGSKNNTKQVVKHITVPDKWNLGKKTRAYYNYATGIVDGSTPGYPTNKSSIRYENKNNEDDILYGGGILNEGDVIVEDCIVLKEGVDNAK